jgi:hypothetical protein
MSHSPMTTGALYAIGYAGLHNAADLHALLGDDVDLVVDIRINRWSRIPAFSTGTQATVET